MANGNLMHGFLNDIEMGEEIDPSTIPDTIVEEVVAANNEVVESGKDLEALNAANTELVEINNEMDVALESNAGPAVMRLVLNRYANLKGKLGIPVSGLEADSKSLDVTADDIKNAKEESKGVFAKIGDFISKVWKAIKDGIAKVWAKMKEFWAWLTGKNKKAEEKIIKSEIAKAAVTVAADTTVDLENKEQLDSAVKDEVAKQFPNIKKADELFAAGMSIINMDALRTVRIKPEESKKTLEELMNNRIADKFKVFMKDYLRLLVLTNEYDNTDSIKINPFKEFPDLTCRELQNILNDKSIMTMKPYETIQENIKNNLNKKLSNLTFLNLYSDIRTSENRLVEYFLRVIETEKNDYTSILDLVAHESNKTTERYTKEFSISISNIVNVSYSTNVDTKLIASVINPVNAKGLIVDVAFGLNIPAPKWGDDFKNISMSKDRSINELNVPIKQIMELIDKSLISLNKKKDDSDIADAIKLAKSLSMNVGVLYDAPLKASTLCVNVFSDLANMLDTSYALAELAKK